MWAGSRSSVHSSPFRRGLGCRGTLSPRLVGRGPEVTGVRWDEDPPQDLLINYPYQSLDDGRLSGSRGSRDGHEPTDLDGLSVGLNWSSRVRRRS